jgi:SAM-dependent methyltransferase
VVPGFERDELRSRYDVISFREDCWHAYTGEMTARILARFLPETNSASNWLLNAGAGVYEIGDSAWQEISADLFVAPIRRRTYAVCANVERLPFNAGSLGAVVCVGEVLAYCDPAAAIREFANVLAPDGLLICDFASSRSPRYWLRRPYGRAADLITDEYNGAPERTWVYDPDYVGSLLHEAGFRIREVVGTHAWSALARRAGAAPETALRLQKLMQRLPLPARLADLTTIVASRSASAT